ncbi:hypothetical protein KKA39_01415 [Patescibacteria group bacterium]|nr:hypothetical protein [Patescibacteria group bacterium]
MENTEFILILWTSIFIYLGIGFISAMMLERSWCDYDLSEASPNGGAWITRLGWVILWPLLLIVYILAGPRKPKEK